MGLQNTYGIDTGTSSVKIYSQSGNKIYMEKNMIAVAANRRVIAVGDEAYEMFEKVPSNIQVNSPMAFGMIADIPQMEYVLYSLLKKISHGPDLGSVIYFAVPMDLSSLDKRAYDTVVNSGRMRHNRVFFVERPIADAIALGIYPEQTKGAMIMNIGDQSTEISIISDGRVIISKLIPYGGTQLAMAVCEEIRRVLGLKIGMRTAWRLISILGEAFPEHSQARKVYGIDSLSGLPREEIITSQLIYDGLIGVLRTIGNEIKTFLERTPPQISYQIMKEGIRITGGMTRLPGIDRFLAEYTGYGIELSSMYEQCTVTGLGRIINNKSLQKWASPISQRKL